MVHRLMAAALALLTSSMVFGQPPQSSPAISYTRDIQPIFTEKCVACHACNDAACQLKLESPEGAVRGATKVPVYQGDRSKAVATTRLFYDAHSEEAWRKKGFYSVLDNQGSQAALMARMLELGHKTPLTPNAKLPEDIVLGLERNNMCPLPHEFDAYAGAHPKEGMPLAVTGLTDKEYQTLQHWLAAARRSSTSRSSPVRRKPVRSANGKSCSIALARPRRWSVVGCTSTCSWRTSTSWVASRATSSSGCVRARQAASRST